MGLIGRGGSKATIWSSGIFYRIERVGGPGVQKRVHSLRTQQKAAREAGEIDQILRIERQIRHLDSLTEYTCWSATYERGFHDPSRFGIVEFTAKRPIP